MLWKVVDDVGKKGVTVYRGQQPGRAPNIIIYGVKLYYNFQNLIFDTNKTMINDI